MYPYLEYLKQRLAEIHADHPWGRLKVLAVGLGSGTLQSFLGLIFIPTCRQEGPKLLPRSPKTPQLLAKTPQDSPKSLQQDPPRPKNVAGTP